MAAGKPFTDDLAGEGEVRGAARAAEVGGVAGEVGGGWWGAVCGGGGDCCAGAVGAGLAPAERKRWDEIGREERWR